jgi:hypothetical protein
VLDGAISPRLTQPVSGHVSHFWRKFRFYRPPPFTDCAYNANPVYSARTLVVDANETASATASLLSWTVIRMHRALRDEVGVINEKRIGRLCVNTVCKAGCVDASGL